MNQELLLDTFLQNNSLNLLTEAVAAAFACPVLITDNSFHIVSAAAKADYGDAEYRRAVAHSELPLALCTAVMQLQKNADEGQLLPWGEKRLFISVLRCAETELGYVIYSLLGEAPEEKDRLFAEALLAKQFYTERRLGGTVGAEELFCELLDGRFANRSLFELRAGGSFLAHFHPRLFAVIDAACESAETADDRLRQSLLHSFHASHPFLYEGRLILFLHEDQDVRSLSQLAERYRFRAVLSEPLETLYDMRRAYENARDTLEYLAEKKPAPFVAAGRDYAFLMQLRRMQGAMNICDEIRRLQHYDRENDASLCITLYTYLSCHHSLQETCKQLFLHRNTVQYRIRKLRDDFGIDVLDSDRTLHRLLSLALVLIEMGEDALFIEHDESAD